MYPGFVFEFTDNITRSKTMVCCAGDLLINPTSLIALTLPARRIVKVTYLYCFHYVVSYSIFVSLLFPIEISVIKNSQIGAKICALSYKTKLNIGQPCRFFAMG